MFDRNRELSSKNREIRGRHAVLAGMGCILPSFVKRPTSTDGVAQNEFKLFDRNANPYITRA